MTDKYRNFYKQKVGIREESLLIATLTFKPNKTYKNYVSLVRRKKKKKV